MQCTLRGQIYSHNFPCSPEGTVTTNLDPPFFVPTSPHISKYLDPLVLIFQKYMDPSWKMWTPIQTLKYFLSKCSSCQVIISNVAKRSAFAIAQSIGATGNVPCIVILRVAIFICIAIIVAYTVHLCGWWFGNRSTFESVQQIFTSLFKKLWTTFCARGSVPPKTK